MLPWSTTRTSSQCRFSSDAACGPHYCPELDVASQGDTIEEARANLVEALTLFFEAASESELKRRLN